MTRPSTICLYPHEKWFSVTAPVELGTRYEIFFAQHNRQDHGVADHLTGGEFAPVIGLLIAMHISFRPEDSYKVASRTGYWTFRVLGSTGHISSHRLHVDNPRKAHKGSDKQGLLDDEVSLGNLKSNGRKRRRRSTLGRIPSEWHTIECNEV